MADSLNDGRNLNVLFELRQNREDANVNLGRDAISGKVAGKQESAPQYENKSPKTQGFSDFYCFILIKQRHVRTIRHALFSTVYGRGWFQAEKLGCLF